MERAELVRLAGEQALLKKELSDLSAAQHADIAQLRTGMSANIRLDAYDYAIYGSVQGELVYISSDTLQEQGPNGQSQTFYRARVRLLPQSVAANPKLQPIVLKPGLTATVDILTGQRSVLSYLIKPITRGLTGALNER